MPVCRWGVLSLVHGGSGRVPQPLAMDLVNMQYWQQRADTVQQPSVRKV